MALIAEVGSFTMPTTTGTKTVSLSTGIWSGATPKLVFLSCALKTTTGYGDNVYHAFGCMTGGTTGFCATQGCDYNVTTSNTYRYDDDVAAFAMAKTWGTGPYALASASSFGAEEFTLNWTTVTGTAQLVYFLALGGDDLTNIAHNEIESKATTGTQAYTGFGFQPDCLIQTGCSQGASGSGTNALLEIGFSDGTTDSGAGWASAHNVGTSKTMRALTADFIRSVWNDTDREEATVDSLDSDGFTLNFGSVQGSTLMNQVLALKGMQVKVLTGLQPTTNTTATRTIGFTPQAALYVSAGGTSSSAVVAGNVGSVGLWDSSNNMSGIAWLDEDNVGTTNNWTYNNSDRVLHYANASQAALGNCSVAASGTDLVETWSNVDGTQREHMIIVFGEPAAGGGTAGRLGLHAISHGRSGLKQGLHPLEAGAV